MRYSAGRCPIDDLIEQLMLTEEEEEHLEIVMERLKIGALVRKLFTRPPKPKEPSLLRQIINRLKEAA